MHTITLAQYATLIEAWRTEDGDPIAEGGAALATCATRLATPTAEQPIVVLAGMGDKGAVGMAAVHHLHRQGLAVRLVLLVAPHLLAPIPRLYYEALQADGIRAWGLSMPQSEMDELEPIHWLSAALYIDALLPAELPADPEGEVVDLIRMVNASRRPILSYELPSGVSSDEGYILSPCIKATYTLALGMPLRAVAEAAPVTGDVWLAGGNIPASAWEKAGLTPSDVQGDALVELGSARRLR